MERILENEISMTDKKYFAKALWNLLSVCDSIDGVGCRMNIVLLVDSFSFLLHEAFICLNQRRRSKE